MKIKPSKETTQKMERDANNWKWFLFYFNKEDKRLFVRKQFPGIGWTINFANRKSILIILLTVLFILLFY